MYRKLLVAVDGSRSAQLAISQAIALAKATGASLVALYVAHRGDLLFDGGRTDPGHVIQAMLAGGTATLETAQLRFDEAGITGSTHLIDRQVTASDVGATIVEYADAQNIDMIVMGTHGRRGLQRLVMGSVAEAVVHRSNKPVLLIRSEAED